ncbi:hypothetical protein HMP0721_1039 [Pseudoramibacter alactolyticus ATCC 23263]|uniref:Uncharacterized protein n=1 Tax=Pseudoramibacter alactolyticus ATCC 23263 TaxID=887929 RepID=E6MGA6_9FIRM|nr:hypothetical protein HMP0721_1039 [Pseudoramibacter alactolyticus ATCC 23263]
MCFLLLPHFENLLIQFCDVLHHYSFFFMRKTHHFHVFSNICFAIRLFYRIMRLNR